jgi:hypothetical protein
MVKKILFYTIFSLSLGISGQAQIALLDEINQSDLHRDQQLLWGDFANQSFMLRSAQDFKNNTTNIKKRVWKDIYWEGLVAKNNIQSNSALPQGFNEGNLYPSIGTQHRVSIGTRFTWKNVELNIQPEWVSARNINPPVFLGNKEDGNFWARYYLHIQNNIDYYTQMGRKPLNTLFPGQSYIAYNYKEFAAGVSTENQWWGPGYRNSLMMTNEAPGFYHFFVKTNKPIPTQFGSFEGKAIVGRLESPTMAPTEDSLMRTIWADGIFRKNKSVRHIEGFNINWQPKWLPNVFIGYSYITQSYILNRNIIGKKLGFFSNDRPKQQLGAITLRIVLPKDHAEIYAELGQPNKAISPWRLFGDSVKTGFVVGARKLVTIGNKGAYLKLYTEFTQLQLMNPALVINVKEPFGGPMYTSWYTSPLVRQGYTHQGKMLGASIGPGSNSQSLGLSWHKGNNKIGLFIERVVHNNDFYLYEYYGSAYFNRYYVDINKGIELQCQLTKNILLAASALQTNALNYKWVREDLPNTPWSEGLWSEPSTVSDKLNVLLNCSLKFNLYAGR